MRRALAALFLFASLSASAATYTVNDLGDASDATAGDNVCATAGAVCTLRAAIEEANAHAGADTIGFSVAGTISPATALPPMTGQTTIDGTTAPGYASAPVVILDGAFSTDVGLHFDVGANDSLLDGMQVYGFAITAVLVDADRVTIRRNYLGPIPAGTPNGDGLQLNGTGSTVGGADGDGNVLSGNMGNGISVTGANHVITDNFIGTDETGLSDFANGEDGIHLDTATGVTIGSATAGEENVISGNGDAGVELASGTGNVIAGNFIGTDVTGTTAIPNVTGIYVSTDAPGTIIGTIAARNVISGNDDDGIDIDAADTVVQNNYVGTDVTGAIGIGNASFGITVFFTSNVAIGGSAAGEGNVVSFNGEEGVFFFETTASSITGNLVGTDAAGTSILGNGIEGILLLNASGITVNGNTISGNSAGGIADAGGVDNIIESNRVGTTADGSAALGNLGTGIELAATVDGIIRSNVISANGEHGVETTLGASGSLIYSNIVGLSADLSTPLGNGFDGINVCDGSSDTVVGSVALGGNIISANGDNGIGVEPTAQQNNTWAANAIDDNQDLGIDIDIDGVTANDADDPDTGANNLQNYPMLTNAVTTATASQILGTIDTLTNTPFTIHFYSSPAQDPSGFGEGATYLGAITGTTDANGDAAFAYSGPALTTGDVVTATATTSDGTSEFSNAEPVAVAPAIAFSMAAYGAGEADGSVTITVTREGDLDAVSTVDYAMSDNTATAGSDYTAASGTLTFNPGENSKSFLVPIANDGNDEPAEIVNLTLSNPTAATLGGIAAAQLTISDDDLPPSISIGNASLDEGNSGTTQFVFDVTLSAASGFTVTVDASSANDTATAGSDYTVLPATTISFAPGVTTQQVTVNVSGDVTHEPSETFSVDLANATNASILDGQATGTIQNDDALPQVMIGDLALAEGSSFTFTLTLSNPSASDITIDYSTADGTAGSSDYTAQTGTATIVAGATSTTISVPVNDDALDEPDETFFVNLTGVTNATIADDQGTGTIQDNDAPAVTIGDVPLAEGNSGMTSFTFTLTLSSAAASDVIINYATANGTATAGSDYTAQSASATILAGSTSTTVTVAVAGDALFENDETFFVNLTGATNATISDAQGLGTIQNDDAQPAVTIDNVALVEGNAGTTPFNFAVTLSAPAGVDVTVNYATMDDTASSASDYTAATGVATIVAGNTGTSIPISVRGDTSAETDETFFVNLTGAANATIADNVAVGAILDDDTVPPAADLTIAKLAGTTTFTPGQQVTYTITVQNLGPAAATGITVTDVLPAGTAYVSATGPDATCTGTSTVNCTIASLGSGASTAITLVVTANSTGAIANTATVSAVSPADGTPANNAASATITPVAAAAAIPTVSEWGLLLLAAALALLALRKA